MTVTEVSTHNAIQNVAREFLSEQEKRKKMAQEIAVQLFVASKKGEVDMTDNEIIEAAYVFSHKFFYSHAH